MHVCLALCWLGRGQLISLQKTKTTVYILSFKPHLPLITAVLVAASIDQLPDSLLTPKMIDRSQYNTGVPAEDLSEYGPGGFHPTYLGDTLNDGQYEIVHKLGFGAYSTVWLARDQR